MKLPNRSAKEKLKLDQMMRVLFRLSKRLTIQLINGLFDEHFSNEEVVSIYYGNSEFVMDKYDRIVVIFLEENEEIGDELTFRLLLPDGLETVYTVPVLRYWTLSPRDLQERRLFALLPLQVFRSRKSMRSIAKSRRANDEKRRLFAQEFERLKITIEQTLDVIRDLHHQRLLRLGDIDRLLQVLDNILNYLYKNYGDHQQTEEVSQMIKTFIDPEVLKRGREQGQKEGMQKGMQQEKNAVARKLLKLGVDIGTIVEATGLSEEEVLKLGRKK